MVEGTKVTKFVDEVHFGATPNGESIGRWPNGAGELVPMSEAYFGRRKRDLPRVGPIVISELHYAPGPPSLRRGNY